MKKFLSYLKLSTLVFVLPVLFSCGDDDDNPLFDLSDPSTFPGTYEMVELTDKSGDLSGIPNLAVQAGQPVTVPFPTGPGQTVDATVTITHTLVLTATTYTSVFNIGVEVTGVGTIPIPPVTDSGTYSVNGDQLTTISAEDGEVETTTIFSSNGNLAFEDDDIKIVYEKQ